MVGGNLKEISSFKDNSKGTIQISLLNKPDSDTTYYVKVTALEGNKELAHSDEYKLGPGESVLAQVSFKLS